MSGAHRINTLKPYLGNMVRFARLILAKFSLLCHLPHTQSAEHTPDGTLALAPTERVSEAC